MSIRIFETFTAAQLFWLVFFRIVVAGRFLPPHSMTSFRVYAERQEPCRFHGSWDHMNNVYLATMEEWAPYTSKVFEKPDQLETLSRSLWESQYNVCGQPGLSKEMKKFFEELYDNIVDINTEAYSKGALAYITVIRHKVPSNESKMIMLGCKKCNRITNPLFFASTKRARWNHALNVLQSFFVPYCPEVRSAGGEWLDRKTYWWLYWQEQAQCAIPDSLRPAPSTDSSHASSLQQSEEGSEPSSSSQGPPFVNWVPDPKIEPDPYGCIVQTCRRMQGVLDPPRLDLGPTYPSPTSDDEVEMMFGS